jgi:hypothetical protein
MRAILRGKCVLAANQARAFAFQALECLGQLPCCAPFSRVRRVCAAGRNSCCCGFERRCSKLPHRVLSIYVRTGGRHGTIWRRYSPCQNLPRWIFCKPVTRAVILPRRAAAAVADEPCSAAWHGFQVIKERRKASGATVGFAQQCCLVALSLQLEPCSQFPIARVRQTKHC